MTHNNPAHVFVKEDVRWGKCHKYVRVAHKLTL